MTSNQNGTSDRVDWELQAEMFCHIIHMFKNWVLTIGIGLHEIELDGNRLRAFDKVSGKYHYLDLADPDCFTKLKNLVERINEFE